MRTTIAFHFALLLAADSATAKEPAWTAIAFPPLTTATGTEASLYLKPGERGLEFRMLVSTDDHAAAPAMFRNKTVSARLHRPGGRVVAPSDDLLNAGVGASNAGSTTWNAIAYFPWTTNQLEEGWIELHIGLEEYWLEIPYGFTTAPTLASTTATNGAGPPTKAPAVKTPDRRHLLRWETVEYNFGTIQNGWSLSIKQSNPWDLETEMVLYHDPGRKWGWDLHTPETTAQVRGAKGRVQVGRCTGIVEHDDGLRRSDTFKIPSFGGTARDWGTLEITVENQVYETPIPSSLYRSQHGHAAN